MKQRLRVEGFLKVCGTPSKVFTHQAKEYPLPNQLLSALQPPPHSLILACCHLALEKSQTLEQEKGQCHLLYNTASGTQSPVPSSCSGKQGDIGGGGWGGGGGGI